LVDKYHSLIERTRSLGEMVDSSAGPRKCKISLEHLVVSGTKKMLKKKKKRKKVWWPDKRTQGPT
jgi:hypothetical protein